MVAVLRARRTPVWVSVSATTRAPRPGERDGESYRFLDDPGFDALLGAGELLEHDEHFGARYGTPRGPVEAHLSAGQPVLLEIDVAGARQVRRAAPGLGHRVRLVFLAPPSWDELVRRLAGRATEDDEALQGRLARARAELAAAEEFDDVIVNDDVERAADRLLALADI